MKRKEIKGRNKKKKSSTMVHLAKLKLSDVNHDKTTMNLISLPKQNIHKKE